MKALVMSEPGHVKMTEIPTPVPKEDEVLVKIHASGICVNDVRDFKGDCNFSYPVSVDMSMPEKSVEMGSAVNKDRFHVGQKVVTYIIDNCNECYYCKNGI